MKRYAKLIVPALTVVASALFAPATAQAATTTQVAHNCVVLGKDSNNQAVVCADIYYNTSTGYYPVAEAYCQSLKTPTSYPQCANADVVFTGYDTTGVDSDTTEGVCGHANGPCVSGGRNYFENTYFWDLSCATIWTDIAAGSTVELPGSDQTKTLSANFASAHYNIPGC